MNSQGMTGATFYMFNHGLATAVMFLVAGYLIRRRGSTLISDHGGVEKVAPVLAGLFLIGGSARSDCPASRRSSPSSWSWSAGSRTTGWRVRSR